MSIPLTFLRTHPSPPSGVSLGDFLASKLEGSNVSSLLDCLCSTPSPAIFSPDSSRPPLFHNTAHQFVSDFVLPNSQGRKPLGPNDRIMIVLPTGPENALALMALASYHTCAPVNASCTAQELKEDAERLRAKAIVTTRQAERRLDLQSLSEELGCDVIFVDERSSGPAGLFDMSVMGVPDTEIRIPSQLHSMDDQSLVLHTSGTSGKKKVVPYTLRHLIVGTWAVVESWNLQPSDVNMNMMPLFHVGGIIRNLWAPMLSGGSAIMCAGFDAIVFWNLASELQATWYYAAPTIHHTVLTSEPEGVADLKIRMICNAAGGLLPSLAVSLQKRFDGAVVLPSYGMTECMPISTPLQDYKLDRPGCSGLACGPYMSIRDPFNFERELPQGQTGAVCVRGLPTFSGYEVSSDITAALDTSAFSSEGWFDGGDVGYMDADGYLYVTGRSKEIINKGGEVISPFEIEEAIVTAAKEYVKTTLAFAVEHEVLQETIGVIIVPIADRPRLGLSQLQDLLHEHLHPSKWPFLVVYMDDLPKNSAGKPLRIKLANRLGVGRLSDSVHVSERHFEAEVPSPMAALTDPIACRKVHADLSVIEKTLMCLDGIEDAAVRSRFDGTPEAFVEISNNSNCSSTTLKDFLSETLPGYSIPDPIHVLPRPLARTASGDVDFNRMEEEVLKENTSAMSRTVVIVRDVVAELLAVDAAIIIGESDFFLLGGNSLLLGKLSYALKKKAGVVVPVSIIFVNSTIEGIAAYIDNEEPPSPSETLYDVSVIGGSGTNDKSQRDVHGERFGSAGETDMMSRGQTHPVSLIVQAIPILFFYPFKAAVTWSLLLFILQYLAPVIDRSYFLRMVALLTALSTGRLGARIICPIGSIIFKWIVIGRYKPGTYKMWSTYYLRYWIVNQSLRAAGRGIFSAHPALELFYARLLGAHIGKNVIIDGKTKLGEYDLLTIEDDVRIDAALVRGFCVDREGCFRLDNVTIGRGATINTYTVIAPGANIAENAVYGPHASSHDPPSPPEFKDYNRTLMREPHFLLKLFVVWPIMAFVMFVSYIPWFAALWLMLDQVFVSKRGMNSLESVIRWFASPTRVGYHVLARILRVVISPLIQLVLGVIFKRLIGLNKPCKASEFTQLYLLRRYLTSKLLSREKLKGAFSILGTHYEIVSIVYRAMGAKIGQRVYWPGSGLVCPEPELLEIGNDVVFGSRLEVFTSDSLGAAKIVVGDGAMVADRVVLLPGTTIGRRAVMGSGALGKRDGVYEDGSTWMGNDGGEAMCFSRGTKDFDPTTDTTTPFGRAYHKRQANYFVYPYPIVLFIQASVATLSAAYWSMSAVIGAQILKLCHIHFHDRIFAVEKWYRYGTLFGLIGCIFVIVLNLQALLSLSWVIATKWIVIGQRKPGRYDWDTSSYCQRWQLHLTLSRPIYKGYGNGGVLAPLTGTAYIVWFYRALGGKIGKNVSMYPGGKTGLLTEPDLIELGDDVCLDNCSVVAHINSRGNFSLNPLKIGNGCALRNGSRLLSGASMEDSSMLLEHTLLTSGEIAESGTVYVGWPGRPLDTFEQGGKKVFDDEDIPSIVCPVCHCSPTVFVAPMCGHLFCESCIAHEMNTKHKCPLCDESNANLTWIHPSFV